MVKIISRIAVWLFVLCLPALLISASIGWGFNSLWLYEYGFQKYGVSQSTGLPPAELEKAARGLIDYFNSGGEYVNITIMKEDKSFPLFTREEAIHFKDVKDLVRLDYLIFFLTLAYALVFALVCLFRREPAYRRKLAGSLLWGSVLTLALMLLTGVGVVLNFERLFLFFHTIAFSNQYWSASGYMLLLFPGGFWYDAAMIVAAAIAAMALIIGILSFLYLKSPEKR